MIFVKSITRYGRFSMHPELPHAICFPGSNGCRSVKLCLIIPEHGGCEVLTAVVVKRDMRRKTM
jgi:hypothetical protein